MATDYLPKSFKNLRDWLRVQQDSLPEIAPAVGMTAAEQTDYLATVEELLAAVGNIVELTEQLDRLAADFEEKLAQRQPLLRQHIKRAKTSPGCTPGVLHRMAWVGGNNDIDPAHSAPSLVMTPLQGRVKAEGTKPGFEAINLYMRRKGETEWRLAVLRKRRFPAYDETPLAQPGVPEVREYRALGVVDDEETGQPSAVVEVVFAG